MKGLKRRAFLASLLAASTLTAADASPLALRIFGKGSNAFGLLPAIVYDQGMGTTDTTGLVVGFALRSTGAKRLWVNTSTGSSSYNGLSPYPGYRLNGTGTNYQIGATGPGTADTAYGPKASAADGLNAFAMPGQPGEGNQIFFAEGQSFVFDTVTSGMAWFRGYSAAYPFCYQSYDPADPLNTAKHGRAGTGSQGARPVLTQGTGNFPSNYRGDAVDYGSVVIRGLKFQNTTGINQAVSYPYCQNNMLIENCVFDAVQIIFDNSNPNAGYDVSNNNIVRRCTSYGQYDTGGSHACGMHSYRTNLTIEDSVWWHCGWKVGGSRDDAVSAGGPDIFKHCLYIANGASPSTGIATVSKIRRNVCVDGSASGLSLRGAHICHHNVMIDCPTPDFKGGGAASDTDNPNGVSQKAWCHLVIGGDDINSTTPRGQGFSCSDGTADSFYNYSLYVNNPKYGLTNNQWLAVANSVSAQPTYMSLTGNRAYAFAPPAYRLVRTVYSGGADASIYVLVDSDNVLSTTSPMTTAALYAAVGYASKAALVAAMIADPMQNWAYKLLQQASIGFSFDFNKMLIAD